MLPLKNTSSVKTEIITAPFFFVSLSLRDDIHINMNISPRLGLAFLHFPADLKLILDDSLGNRTSGRSRAKVGVLLLSSQPHFTPFSL